MKFALAGNIIVDKIFPIRGFPPVGQLCPILDGMSQSVGGVVCNDGIDLKRLLPAESVTAIGFVGQDADGDYALRYMQNEKLDCSLVRRSARATSFTHVMNDAEARERTFFTYSGANDDLTPETVPLDAVESGSLLLAGYILLLKGLDAGDDEYGTKMARLLCEAKRRGILTSVDVVSEAGDRFSRLVPPALKYTDYCIINELEAGSATKIPLRDEKGALLTENIPAVLSTMREMGVTKWAVIHAPEGAWGTDEKGRFASCASVDLPKSEIRGKTGAGDAFCSGVIAGLHEDMTLPESLWLGGCAAALSLTTLGATDAIMNVEETLKFGEKWRQ